ncbi:MAG: hypothetical protein KGD64_13815 [Candidatus Heimdallarchaeota archaeon]|nr:hypothetical protein [Candidatus Heimdallarchaeota archaeon]
MNKPKIQFTTSIILSITISILTGFIKIFSSLTGTVGGAAESTKSNKTGPYQYDNGEDEV